LNNAGQAAGYSERYSGATALGQDAWFYDDETNQTISLIGSVRLSDGYAFSSVSYLGEDGLALGYYSLFDQTTNAGLGQRAFYFTQGEGFSDLGLLVADMNADGWASLSNAIRANGIGNIIGTGKTSPNPLGQTAYILTPAAVPVPASAWLLGSGLISLAGVTRKRKAA
jgi:hypothetical protein